MQVLIAANGSELDSRVAKRFGHAPFYLVTDTDTGQIQVIDNQGQHDDSHAIIPRMVEQGVTVFVTGNIGPHAFQLIQSSGCRVALARKLSAAEALASLQRGDLEFLSEPTVKHSIHNHSHHTS